MKHILIFLSLFLFSLTIISCSSSSDSGSKSTDTTPPTVSSSYPSDGDTSVSITSTVSVTFSETMDTSSVTTNTLDTSCFGTFLVSSDGFTSCLQMSSSPTSSNSDKTFTVTPKDSFSYSTIYRIRITTGTKDSSGDSMTSQWTTSSGFQTTDNTTVDTSDTDVAAVSGSGSITLSAKVSVVEPKTTDSTARTARTAYAIDTTGFAFTTDYNVDETQTFVFEESADVLDTVNSILCEMGQTRPGLMRNEGDYKAQVDSKKCGPGDGDAKSNAPSYDIWTVNSSRSEGEPMIVKAWVPNDEGLIRAKMKVYRKP